MNEVQLLKQRLINQHLAKPKFSSVPELISYMGAIQAQDFAMSKWAIGLRIINPTQKKVEAALNKGSILRTHILRPTWHLVSAADIYWMLELTARNIIARMRTNDKKLGITETLFKKSNAIIEKALIEHEQLNRDEIIQLFNKHKIAVNENRLSHFLIRAEQDAIICSGKIVNNKNMYVLLAKHVTKKKAFNHEEALAMLATKYFESRGPATLADFTWWSGLAITDAKKALHLVDSTLEKETMNGIVYYFTSSVNHTAIKDTFALPSFDEYLISYKNRLHIVHSNKKNISANGIFWPVMIADGKVIGMWNRKITNDNVHIQTEYFTKPAPAIENALRKGFSVYAKFINKHLTCE